MAFNPDLSKQAQKVISSRKIKKLLYLTLLFNNIPLTGAQLGVGQGGDLPCPENALILEKNALIASIVRLNLPFKM